MVGGCFLMDGSSVLGRRKGGPGYAGSEVEMELVIHISFVYLNLHLFWKWGFGGETLPTCLAKPHPD